MQVTLLAEYLCNLQPMSIRNRLLHDPTFGARLGLGSRLVLTLGGDVHVDQQDLITAVRQACVEQGRVPLMDVYGHEMAVQVEQGRVFLASPTQGRKDQLDEFLLLSPHREERVQALQRFVDFLGPTAPDFSALLSKASERALSDEEVAELFAERASGVAALQSHTATAFHTNQVTIDSLIPHSLTYFERFCGPLPGDMEHEEYFRTILPRYRTNLIRRDLVRGLDICLQGALRDDLMPGAWTAHLNDDELWEALTAFNPWCDPFALLGALDIALGRQHNERYQHFAEDALTKLVQEAFPRPDGIDVYELMPLFAALVLNRINTLEDGAVRPPCWKRMCAWMQAGFLVRVTQQFPLALERALIMASATPFCFCTT